MITIEVDNLKKYRGGLGITKEQIEKTLNRDTYKKYEKGQTPNKNNLIKLEKIFNLEKDLIKQLIKGEIKLKVVVDTLEKLRKARGLKRADIVKHISHVTYYNIEQGNHKATIPSLISIGRMFKLSLDDVVKLINNQ